MNFRDCGLYAEAGFMVRFHSSDFVKDSSFRTMRTDDGGIRWHRIRASTRGRFNLTQAVDMSKQAIRTRMLFER
jgi:hypothetical protein